MEKTNTFWDLAAGKLHDELDHSDSTYFEQLTEDENNKLRYEKAKKISASWGEVKKLKRSNVGSSWKLIEKSIRQRRLKQYSLSISKYAALLIFAFVSGIYFHSEMKENHAIQYTEIEVQNGQTSHLFLFDGTEVWLNSGTVFRYPNRFNQDERNVFIDGEAFFKVTPNTKIPFKVKTTELEVEVLGTSFNVSAYHSELKQSVVLEQGKVQINNLAGKKIGSLAPGQMAVKTKGTSLQIEHTNPYFYTSWKDGKVVFNAEKLGDIAEKLERWYNIEIRFEQESLKDFEFTGTILRNKPINQTIMALELLAPIRFNYQIRTNEKDVITIIEK